MSRKRRTGRYAHVQVHPVPYARAVLLDLAKELSAAGFNEWSDQIHDVVYDLMFRRAAVRHTRVKRKRVTSEMVPAVKLHAARNPEQNCEEIGMVFQIDGGRVSEILQGLRTVEDPTMSRLRDR